MAKKVTPGGVAVPPVRRSRFLLPVAFVGVAVAGGVLAWVWQRHRAESAVVTRLAVMPEVSGRPDEFRRILQEALDRVRQDPASLASVAQLGAIYHVNNETERAAACWSYLHEREPKQGKWCYYLSDLSRMRADESGLRSWLEETVKCAPEYAPAWLELGDLEFKTARLERAEEAYRQRARLIPGDPYAALGLARIALQRDRVAEGKALIEDLVKRVPDFSSAHNIYAELLAQSGDQVAAANQRWLGTIAGRFRAAPDPWKEELRQWCCDVDQLIVWGAIDAQTKQGDLGRAAFEKAVRLEPANPQGYENLGRYYLDAGAPAKAAALLEEGSRLPRASELLFSSLGEAYLAQRQPDKVLAMVDRAVQLIPSSSMMQNLRGMALAASNRPQEAMEAYRQAMAAAAGSPEPVTNLGLLLLQLGRREEAVAALKQALELQPSYVKAARSLAYLQLEAGDLPAAAKLVFAYFQQFPGLPGARTLMSRYYLALALQAARQQDNAGAEQACRQGLAIVPESVELMGFLGVSYVQQGKSEEALQVMEKAHQLQPGEARVALMLGELYLGRGRGAEARPLIESALQQARQRNDAAMAARAEQLLGQLP